MRERFVARHGSDLVLVEGNELADLYADAIGPAGDRDTETVASSRALARRTIEESELADADQVLVHSHPVAGFGFYRDFVGVARALDSGVDPDTDDLDLLRGYLDDPGVPSWLLRRIVAAAFRPPRWPSRVRSRGRTSAGTGMAGTYWPQLLGTTSRP